MTLTRISEKNIIFFEPLLFCDASQNAPNLLKLGIIENSVACAAIAVVVESHKAEIVSLYVSMSHRRKGFASALLKAVESLLTDAKINQIDAYVPPMEREIIDFLGASDFDLEESVLGFSFPFSCILESELLEKYVDNRTTKCIQYGALNKTQFISLASFLSQRGISPKEILETDVSASLSMVVFDKNGQVISCLLCSEYKEQISIDLLLMCPDNPTSILTMFYHLQKELSQQNNPDLKIFFFAKNEKTLAFVQKLFGDKLKNEGPSYIAIKTL